MRLQGNTVLVTGGASGIGRCIVQELVARDNTVIVCGRDARKLQALAQELPQVKTIAADLSSPAEVERLAALLLRDSPALNGVIHSAAVQHNHLMTDEGYEAQRIDEEVRLNLVAPMLLTKLLLPSLLRQKVAFLVNITSGLAMVPKTRSAVYCGTKGGLRIFSQSLRHQLRGTPVRVVELLPPVVDTPMTHGRAEGRKLPPEQVARELMQGLERDKEEIRVGKVKLLAWLQRLAPGAAARVMSRMAIIPLLLLATRTLAQEAPQPSAPVAVVQTGVVTDCFKGDARLFGLERHTQPLEDGRTSMRLPVLREEGGELEDLDGCLLLMASRAAP